MLITNTCFILIQKSQQDAHVTEFILFDDCSTCFGYHYHPSSGAQNNCNYRSTRHPQHTQISSNSSTIAADNNTVYRRKYSEDNNIRECVQKLILLVQ
jgi:hypothetical protein